MGLPVWFESRSLLRDDVLNTHWKLANPANDLVPNPSQLENASIRAKASGPSSRGYLMPLG